MVSPWPGFWLSAWLGMALSPHDAAAAEPVRVILDTDLSSDVDDVGAVAVLHALADAGEAEILGMGISRQRCGQCALPQCS